jgi:hypothetical protein
MAVMSQATGLDNSHLLPPYFPVFRGEDYLFASLVVCLHPDAAVLDFNWSIPHLPLEQRGVEDVSAALQLPADPLDIPGVPDGLAEEALLLKIKTVMAEFSAAITAWPAIRTNAATITRQMHASGELTP